MHSKADSDDLRKSMLCRSFLFKQNTHEWDIMLGNSIVWYLSKLCTLLKFTEEENNLKLLRTRNRPSSD